MIEQLTYDVTFPTTGKRFKNSLQFAPGLTAIVGGNESGKSLVLEFIRYAWFGKGALRGVASDYKNLSVTLTAIVKGKKVVVIRQPHSEKLYIDGVQTAVGAEAINKFIPMFLGFGLDVHDIALAAMQDNLHALTEMKPTARRAMIDQLTGTNVLESIEKECRVEAKELSKVASTLTESVSEPVPVPKPEGVDQLDALVKRRDDSLRIEGVRQALLEVERPQAPVEPEPVLGDEVELEALELLRHTVTADKLRLETELSQIPVPTLTPEQFEQYKLWLDYSKEKNRRGPEPEYTSEQLEGWKSDWNNINAPVVECPECGAEFVEASGVNPKNLTEPPLTLLQIKDQLDRHVHWSTPLEVVEYTGPTTDFTTERKAHEGVTRSSDIQLQLQRIIIPIDRSSNLNRLRDYKRNRAVYEEKQSRYQHEEKVWQEAQTKLQEIGEPEDLSEINTQISDIHSYQKLEASYQTQLAHYNSIATKITDHLRQAEGWESGMKALKATRLVVKQELVPSLSKASSFLLKSLSNGERELIIIDQDFNVTVDNQPLHTLSGSGKAVVNLALRIGLAQVLTSQVLSLFMGDEIDGSMDKNRVDATHETFKRLTQHIGQVILVTHKAIEADHTIEIGSNND